MKRPVLWLACAWAFWASGDFTQVKTRGLALTGTPRLLEYYPTYEDCRLAYQWRTHMDERDRQAAREQGVAVQGEMQYKCLPQGVQPTASTTWD
jgi:hypothetical protein